jgi:hypothetical protein
MNGIIYHRAEGRGFLVGDQSQMRVYQLIGANFRFDDALIDPPILADIRIQHVVDGIVEKLREYLIAEARKAFLDAKSQR